MLTTTFGYGLDSYGLCSCGPCSYGLCSYGLCSYGLYSYGLDSYGLDSYGLDRMERLFSLTPSRLCCPVFPHVSPPFFWCFCFFLTLLFFLGGVSLVPAFSQFCCWHRCRCDLSQLDPMGRKKVFFGLRPPAQTKRMAPLLLDWKDSPDKTDGPALTRLEG